MKGLDTLIKLHKRALDELRRAIGVLENQKLQLQNLSRRLADELRKEMEEAGKRPEMGQFFGGFAKRIKTRQEHIATEIKALDKKIDTLTDEARAAYGELKKYEVAKANAKRRAEKEAQRKETIRLDEIAGQQDRRKRKN